APLIPAVSGDAVLVPLGGRATARTDDSPRPPAGSPGAPPASAPPAGVPAVDGARNAPDVSDVPAVAPNGPDVPGGADVPGAPDARSAPAPSGSGTSRDEPPRSGWHRHQVEMEFVIRGGRHGADGGTEAFEAIVPVVLDSELAAPRGVSV